MPLNEILTYLYVKEMGKYDTAIWPFFSFLGFNIFLTYSYVKRT